MYRHVQRPSSVAFAFAPAPQVEPAFDTAALLVASLPVRPRMTVVGGRDFLVVAGTVGGVVEAVVAVGADAGAGAGADADAGAGADADDDDDDVVVEEHGCRTGLVAIALGMTSATSAVEQRDFD